MEADDPPTRPDEPAQAPPPAGPGGPPAPPASGYPLEFDVEYPDRDLNRLSSALRIFWVIPIAIVLGMVSHTSFSFSSSSWCVRRLCALCLLGFLCFFGTQRGWLTKTSFDPSAKVWVSPKFQRLLAGQVRGVVARL